MSLLRRFMTGLALAMGLLVSLPAAAQQTVGLFVNEAPQEGLTLFGPTQSTTAYLINPDGLLVNSWSTPFGPGLMGYLLESGNLLRTARLLSNHANFAGAAGSNGRLEEYDWDGTLVWRYDYASAFHLPHHDIVYF